MATAYLNGKAGVWRTVGGRKIFIANGQSLKDAMRASGKFKNLKDDIKDMDEDDIKAELRNNRAKMKNASKEEDKELRLRNHKLMMELDRRWGEDEKKYKEQQNKKPKTNDEIDSRIAELEKKRDAQSFNNPIARDAQKEIDKLQKQKNKNSAKAVLVDAEADFKYAQKTYPEDHVEYKQALKNYKQAIDDYEYAGGKVADSKKAKLGNTGDDADYKKAVFEDAKADFDFVKNEYPKDSAQYKRAKEAYDRAKYDVDKINKNQEVPTKYLDRGEMMNVVDKWSSKGFDEEGAFGNIGGRGVFHEKFASGQLEGWGGQEDDFVIKGFDLGSADPKVALKGLNDELNKVGYEAKYLKDEWYSHQDIEIKKIKSPATKSVKSLNEIDRLAGDDDFLQKKGRELGLNEFKRYMATEEARGAKNIEKIQQVADRYGFLPHEVQDMVGLKDSDIEFGKGNQLIDHYRNAQSISDDWFAQNAREIGLSEDTIAKEIYNRKGIATTSSDDFILSNVAKQERQYWETQLEKTKSIVNDKNVSKEMRDFAKNELQAKQEMVDRYKEYEKKFESRIPMSTNELAKYYIERGYSKQTAQALAREQIRNRK